MKNCTSSRIARGTSRTRRGSATVEFALLAPLLVVLVLWSNYFWDLQRVRLKGAELARYVAFERTVKSDVDRIAAEAQERYKDLDGATKTGELDSTFEGRITVAVRARNADAPLTSSSLSAQAPGGLTAATNTAMRALGGTVDVVARQMGLDSRQGAIQTDVELTIRNGFIPETFALYTTGFANGRLDMRITERFYLFHDTWRAWEPGDAPRNTYQRVEQLTYERVRHIAYAGVAANSSGALNSISSVLQVLGLDSPFSEDYLRKSVRILRVPEQPKPVFQTLPRETRTVPGDVLQAAYWLNDTAWCVGICEPQAVQQKRGLSQNGGYGDNWPMRAYNCRGPYFQGARRSELPESVYSDAAIDVDRGLYHHYNGSACQ